MLAPISWRTPPEAYGAWELVTSLMTEGLVAQGVDVTLFATGDSLTKAKLESVIPHGYSDDRDIDPKVAECLHISDCFERADEFDLIHNNFDFLPLTYSRLVRTPVVTTIHGFSSEKIVAVYRKYNHHVNYVSISNANRHPGPELRRHRVPRHRHRGVHPARAAGRLPAVLRPAAPGQGGQ